MAQDSATLITLATQIAKTPGFTSQAGDLFNIILSDLCQTYDFDVARGTYTFNFNPGLITTDVYPNIQPGGGPYPLPADFLRMASDKEFQWFLLGVPYPMIPCDLDEYDNMVQQAGLQSYPYIFATDMSSAPPNGENPVLVVWPPASGAYPCLIRYRRQMPDIAAPLTPGTIPWFPNQTYLLTRLAGELMKFSGDPRRDAYLKESALILDGYLKMKDDSTDRAQKVGLDRRQFGRAFSALKNTKLVGW